MDWLELTRLRDDLRKGKTFPNSELSDAVQWAILRIHRLEDVLDDVYQAINRDWREK